MYRSIYLSIYDPVGCLFGCDGSPDSLSHYCQCPILSQAMRLARGSATPEEDEDVIVFLGLSPIEPTRAASLFLVYHTARAASGRLVPTRIRSKPPLLSAKPAAQ